MRQVRLHCVVEGQTEEAFVNTVLAPDLARYGVFTDVHRVTTGRRHGQPSRGGMHRYDHLARDLVLWMKQDQQAESWYTTLVDLYALPKDFPGRKASAKNHSALTRVEEIEAAMAKDIAARLEHRPVARRFIPYIQLHEFEALLFSEPAAFEEAFPDDPPLIKTLKAIRDMFSNPEDINDGPATAPSKRIIKAAPDYLKVVAGPLIARRIGLDTMARECPHFGSWSRRLRTLAGPDLSG